MGTITILPETTKNPLSAMGKMVGVCYNSNTDDENKNIKRAIDCIQSGHERVLEYAQAFFIIDGYSARVIRELYTHIGGMPTRLQASTRYIDYTKGQFDYVVPPKIEKDKEARLLYVQEMLKINKTIRDLIDTYDIPKEDASMLLPLGMSTKMVFRTNARQLIDMSHQRLCTRAYWEFRALMKDLMKQLSEYDEQWREIINNRFCPKCIAMGYCNEKNSCGYIKMVHPNV